MFRVLILFEIFALIKARFFFSFTCLSVGVLRETVEVLEQGMDKVRSDRVFCLLVILLALLASMLLYWIDHDHQHLQQDHLQQDHSSGGDESSLLLSWSSTTSNFLFLNHLLPCWRLFCLSSWVGSFIHKMLFAFVLYWATHLALVSVFEHRALLANLNAVKLRLKNEGS